MCNYHGRLVMDSTGVHLSYPAMGVYIYPGVHLSCHPSDRSLVKVRKLVRKLVKLLENSILAEKAPHGAFSFIT